MVFIEASKTNFFGRESLTLTIYELIFFSFFYILLFYWRRRMKSILKACRYFFFLTKMYVESYQTSIIDFFCENGQQLLWKWLIAFNRKVYLQKTVIVDAWQGPGYTHSTKKMRFSIKDFFSFLRIWSHLLKKSLM